MWITWPVIHRRFARERLSTFGAKLSTSYPQRNVESSTGYPQALPTFVNNYVDNFFGFRTFARRVEDCFSSRRIDSGDRFRHFFRLARPNPQNRSSESILSFHGFLRVPLRNSPQSSAPTDPLTKGSHEESNVSNPLPRRIHQNPPEQPKTALFGKSVQKVPFFVSQKRCVSWCCFA